MNHNIRLAGLLPALLISACSTTGSLPAPQPVAEDVAPGIVTPTAPAFDMTALKGVVLPDYERIELPNGAVLLLAERHDVPLIGLQAILRGGALADPDGKAGVGAVVAKLLQKGAGERDAQAFAAAVENVGGKLSVGAGVETLQVSGNFLSRDVELMLELFDDVLKRPHFAAEEFVKVRDRAIQLLKAAKDSDPRQLITTYGAAALFGEHPYGRPSGGDETSLAAIELADINKYYRQQVGADRLIVAVVGDFDAADMRRRLTTMLGDWRAASAPLPTPTTIAPQPGRRVVLVDKPGATQTYFWIGNVGVARDYQRRAELDLANTVFGGRFTSMLNTELRIKSGLTYGASSRLSRPTQRGSLAMVSFTQTETTVPAIDLALETLELLRSDGLDATALRSAQAYVLGKDTTRLETSDQLAAQIASMEFFGLSRDYVDGFGPAIVAANEAAVHDVIRDVYPASENLVFVMIGDADKIRADVAKYGALDEFKLAAPGFQSKQ